MIKALANTTVVIVLQYINAPNQKKKKKRKGLVERTKISLQIEIYITDNIVSVVL